MKKYSWKSFTFLLIVLFISFSASSQIFVRVRPFAPIIKVRTVSPSPRHIWVDGNWVWRGGNYVWEDGYWGLPAPGFHQYIPGHWKMKRRGWVWIPGHWR